MSDPLITIAHYLFGWTLITLALSWLLAGIYPLFSRSLSKLNAMRASFFTLLYSLLPLAAASLTLIALSLPNLAFSFVADHCHGALCTPHTLYMTTDTIEGIVFIAFAVTALTSVFVLMINQLLNSRKHLQALASLSEAGSQSYLLVDSRQRLAWCAGLLKPQVYLSKGLVDTLTAQQMRVIMAHEQMHVLRRDNLRKWFLYWATIAWPTVQKRRVRLNFTNYSECICDFAAAQVNQGKLDLNAVIDALVNCYSNATDTRTKTRASDADFQLQQRIRTFEHELDLQVSNSKKSDIDYLKSGFFIAGIWTIAVITAIHFGHPLLEWLSK